MMAGEVLYSNQFQFFKSWFYQKLYPTRLDWVSRVTKAGFIPRGILFILPLFCSYYDEVKCDRERTRLQQLIMLPKLVIP